MTLVDNILAVYRSASFAAFSEGMGWYDDAHDFALALDPTNIERAAGIIAALSPMNGWGNNKRKASLFYSINGAVQWDGSKNGIGLGNSVRAAERIWNGEAPLDVMRGRKIRSFYQSIVDPNSDTAEPVIDRHAFDIAMGRVTSDKERSTLGKKGEYDRFAQAYRDAARILGITPKQVQAITWVAWREQLGKEWHG